MKIKSSFPTRIGVRARLIMVMGIALAACTKEEIILVNCGCGCGNGGSGSDDGGGSTSAQFYSPILTATTENYQAYNGYLEVVTCTGDEFAYYGNYSADDVLGSEPAYYEVVDGYATNSTTPLRLPLGTYKFIYYGHDSKAAAASIDLTEPKLVVGSPLSGTMFELLQRSDTTYRPTHAFVLGYQEANVGSDSLHANLSQATAALKLTVSNSDGSAMSDAIDSIWIHVGSIAKHISVTTGDAGTETVTVSTQLNRSDDALSYETGSVYLFPSGENPPVTIFIRLKNGMQKQITHQLENTLRAGTVTSVLVMVEAIYVSEDDAGGFKVNSWNERSEGLNITFQ